MSGTIDRQDAFSGTREVPQALAFDAERLAAHLGRRIDGFAGPLQVRQFKGGQSNPTYLLDTPDRAYVLRRKPPGTLLPSAHAIDREYRVMSALGKAGFPVPRTFLLCEDEGVIGTAFYVMEKVEGRIFWEPSIPTVGGQERGAIYRAMNATISRLHGFEPEALGLSDFGRAEGYVARQISRWAKQYRASETEAIPEMDRLIEWLPAQDVPAHPPRIVHGDFRLDNLIVAPIGPDVLAVLDWELSTLGDPVADFTYHCMQWVMPAMPDGSGIGSLDGLDLDALGIPGLADYIALYEAATGFEVAERLDFYFAYNFFRIAAILQGIAGRVRDGTAANANAAAMIRQIRPLAETAWTFARQAGA
ncbi:phosphotransferase family protein [Stappia sp. F7233]|uniref:Phosphotransferase family protein n=1 Tax=Stappia albiluteola TaxID=2758565 RepID=A0A839AHF8_9HYPH|nr:phosphotransferase family protein [Stappia albiluteola]MBA5778364.1 phosphotransferase family protein [Stappia albiluteola]